MMEIVEGKRQTGGTIILDGKSFVDCFFENCQLVYHGGQSALINTTFKNCQLALQGEASNTAQCLMSFGWKPPEGWSTGSVIQPDIWKPSSLPN